ncbi:hypothetical protein C808_04463 [Lachnospiraceae bacterium M18-1]|nr:hypothetical protein C808_04463 [Lachnospiraceae bacterium M18-1]
MKPLFKMDIKNYADSDIHIRRPSARAVIRAEDGRLAMVYSRKYQYYKFPGGGIQNGEDNTEALAREVLEERMNDVKKRHGYYPQKKWDRNLWLKEYFEEKMQEELYQAAGTAEKPEVTGHA